MTKENPNIIKIPEKCPNCGVKLSIQQRIHQDRLCKKCGYDVIDNTLMKSIKNKPKKGLSRKEVVIESYDPKWKKIEVNVSKIAPRLWLIPFLIACSVFTIGAFIIADKAIWNSATGTDYLLGPQLEYKFLEIWFIITGFVGLIFSAIVSGYSESFELQKWTSILFTYIKIGGLKVNRLLMITIMLEISLFGIGGLPFLIVYLILKKNMPEVKIKT